MAHTHYKFDLSEQWIPYLEFRTMEEVREGKACLGLGCESVAVVAFC